MSFKIELSRSQEERAMRLHREAIVIDTHSDTLMQLTQQSASVRRQPFRKLGERSAAGHIDLPRLIEGGVTCQTFSMYTGLTSSYPNALKTALLMVDSFYTGMQDNREKIVNVRNSEEIVKAKKDGKVGALLSIEGAEPLMGEVGILRVFHMLGVRMLSFTWNWRTDFADGLSETRAQSKLTTKGIAALEEMQRLGMVFDVSHITDACFWDTVENIKGPFIASHSNSREVCNVPRNLTDDMLKALADKGGVTGMNFAPGFIVSRERLASGYKATVEDLVNHIDHIVKVVGPDHVGLGSDFDGIGDPPVGLEDVSKVPNITRVLVKRGYSDEDILKILGGNFLGVFKKVLG